MSISDIDSLSILRKLGNGVTIAQLCDENGWSRPQFGPWFDAECQRRVPNADSAVNGSIKTPVTVARDSFGIPSIFAESASDMFFGFGVAMAQDRLFQMDFLRRRGLGELSELLGPSHLELDRTARIIGLHRSARAQWHDLDAHTKMVLELSLIHI